MISKLVVFLFVLLTYQSVFGAANRLKRTVNCQYGQIPNGNTCEDCGNRFSLPNVRIVGGTTAVQGSWPSHVFIVQNIKGDLSVKGTIIPNQHIQRRCGATLINRFTIVTAASCIKKVKDYLNSTTLYVNSVYSSLEESFDVYAGAQTLSFLDTGILSSTVAKLTVSKIIQNPFYDPITKQNDIALFILKDEVGFTNYIQPACLPDSTTLNYPPPNLTVFAVGWGQLTETNTILPYELQNVNLQTYSKSTCDNLMNNYGFYVNINNQLCAGKINSGQDSCYGDTGGGLYMYDAFLNKNILVGIRSYGIGCARNDTLGIYTRVNYYNNNYNQWITNNWVTESTYVNSTKLPQAKTSSEPTSKKPPTDYNKTTFLAVSITLCFLLS